jgi:hypothetical protein
LSFFTCHTTNRINTTGTAIKGERIPIVARVGDINAGNTNISITFFLSWYLFFTDMIILEGVSLKRLLYYCTT